MVQLSTMLPGGQAGPFGAPPQNETYASGPFQGAPAVPQGGPFAAPPQDPQARGDSWRKRLQVLLPAISAGFAPAFGLRGSAALMAGILRGQEAKRVQAEGAETARVRKATEAAKFRMDALNEISKLPPEQQSVYMEAMADIGQQLYGVDLRSELGRMQAAGAPAVAAAASAKQKSAAAEVVKSHDAVAKGRRWSAPDDAGTVRPDTWWREQAGLSGTLDDGSPLLPEAPKDEPPDLSKSGLDVQLAEAMRREAAGDSNAAADVARLKKAISETDALRRDPPRVTVVNPAAHDARVNTRIDRITAAFSQSPIVKEFNEVQAQQQTIKQVVNSPWSGPGDMSVVFAFMKALDPNSVVRETEYANASKSGNIFSGWAARFNGALSPSGGFLSEQVKRDFLKTIDARMGVKRQQYENLRTQTVAKVDRIRAGEPETGDEAVFNYGSAFQDEPQSPAAGPKVGERRRFGNKTGEWDGKGWKPVN